MATEAVKAHAIATCDGVIKITEREMLVQGVYITHEVVDHKLAEESAICGGHKACLVGSIFLANGNKYEDLIQAATTDFSVHLPSWFQTQRWGFMDDKPSLRLAYEAFNEAALEIIESEHSEISTEFAPSEDWAEFFFERVLDDEEQEVVQAEVIRLAENAKVLIKTEVVS